MNRPSISRRLLVLCALAAQPAVADEAAAPDPAAVSLAKTFAKICILPIPNLDSVLLTAKIEGWRQVEGPPRETPFLPTSSATQTSWVTRGVDDVPIVVTIAHKGNGTGTMQVTCAVQNPSVSPDAVAKALDGLLPLSQSKGPVSEGDKRISTWNLHFGTRDVGIGLVTDASDKAGAIVSAVNVQNTAQSP